MVNFIEQTVVLRLRKSTLAKKSPCKSTLAKKVHDDKIVHWLKNCRGKICQKNCRGAEESTVGKVKTPQCRAATCHGEFAPNVCVCAVVRFRSRVLSPTPNVERRYKLWATRQRTIAQTFCWR
jgi:hypothetical protein